VKKEMKVEFEAKLVLRFTLPGTRFTSYQGQSGSNRAQLEAEHSEWFRLETTAENAIETVAVLRELANEIERVAKAVAK
jgi:hypothetical protein